MMMDHNSMVEMPHSGDHGDMKHGNEASDFSDCLMTIDCDCNLENSFIATIAPNVVLKTNVSPVLVSISELKSNEKKFSSADFNFSILNYYSPPPLFLANESFLI